MTTNDRFSYDEHALWVNGRDGPLLTFVSQGGGVGPGFLVAPGAGRAGLTKSDGLFIRMAREIAAAGCDVVRFDWRGTGGSLGSASFKDDPVYVDDVVAATSVFDEGRPLALLGSCYGARAVLEAAVEIESTVAVALLAYPMPGKARNREVKAQRIGLMQAAKLAVEPNVIKGWLDPRMRRLYRRWILNRLKLLRRHALVMWRRAAEKPAPERDPLRHLANTLSALAERGVSILFVFGEGEQHLELFADAVEGELRSVLDDFGRQIEIVTTSEGLYGWRTADTIERALEITGEWAERVKIHNESRAHIEVEVTG